MEGGRREEGLHGVARVDFGGSSRVKGQRAGWLNRLDTREEEELSMWTEGK